MVVFLEGQKVFGVVSLEVKFRSICGWSILRGNLEVFVGLS